jgi:molecular chaperone IbpA|tara:strand:+ start:454 stop:897 length:444 start_codon:yes stop_codon:yes gene_type:complete
MTSRQLGDFDVFNFGKSFPFAIGFDRTLQLLERANQSPTNTSYPPYNIVKHDAENFTIELAIAGFTKDDIDISKEKNVLTIFGKQPDDKEIKREFIHRGLAGRSFNRVFTLADDIIVKGADMKNGILSVSLERIVPEEDKPQVIKVS